MIFYNCFRYIVSEDGKSLTSIVDRRPRPHIVSFEEADGVRPVEKWNVNTSISIEQTMGGRKTSMMLDSILEEFESNGVELPKHPDDVASQKWTLPQDRFTEVASDGSPATLPTSRKRRISEGGATVSENLEKRLQKVTAGGPRAKASASSAGDRAAGAGS